MAAVAKKVASKPIAPAIMKKPTANGRTVQKSPSGPTAQKSPATTNGARVPGVAQKSPNLQTVKSAISKASTPKPNTSKAPITKASRTASLPSSSRTGGVKRANPYLRREEDNEYDLDDDFIDNDTDDGNTPLNIQGFVKGLNFYRGPTSLEEYRKLDPENFNREEYKDFADVGDDCMEVSSFADHIAMDAKTAKRAIEEDKREREEEKKEKKREQAAQKRKRAVSTEAKTTTKKKKTA
jgi:hypothetical protein